jgi:putative oxidoreductase
MVANSLMTMTPAESETEMIKLLGTSAPAAVIIIRLMVGAVFISEGTQKFLYPADAGAGRFEKIGIPAPNVLAPLVGGFEIVCGVLVVVGFATRVAAVPLIVIMLTAIATTKIPILLDQGFWKMAHEARTDWSMLLGSLFLLIVGGGLWSIDATRAQ